MLLRSINPHITISCAKNLSPDLALYAICFQIDILVFEGRKETERKKINIGRPRIELVSRQNKFNSGRFSALSTCANEAEVRN